MIDRKHLLHDLQKLLPEIKPTFSSGRIAEKSAEEAGMELRKTSTPVIVRDEGRVVETAAEEAGTEPRKTRKEKRKN